MDSVCELVREYLSWTIEQAEAEIGEVIDVNGAFDRAWSEIDLFQAPGGRILLAKQDGAAAGVAFLKQLRPDVCEIKRAYVRPEFRGWKIGSQLIECLIQEARDIGYEKMFLDTTTFMKAAHKVYRSLGFQDTAIYPESEYGDEFAQHLIFMELIL